jgi:DNA-binding MurR/RpiR family transcriptional regulator
MARTTVEGEIHDAMARLTSAEKRAARGLLANYPTLGLGPVADFARESGASPATVLRFVSQLGFASYPDFQRRLREELEERIKSPLQRPHGTAGGQDHFLAAFADQIAANLRETVSAIPASEFEEICAALADGRAACHVVGGRFTDAVAQYLASHLRIVRAGVRRLEARAASRRDQLLDVKAGDCAIIFDVRRYDPELAAIARALGKRRTTIVLITDQWISPAARQAKFVLPCRVETGRTWDSNASLLAVSEAIIARVTDLAWDKASARMDAIEHLQED